MKESLIENALDSLLYKNKQQPTHKDEATHAKVYYSTKRMKKRKSIMQFLFHLSNDRLHKIYFSV